MSFATFSSVFISLLRQLSALQYVWQYWYALPQILTSELESHNGEADTLGETSEVVDNDSQKEQYMVEQRGSGVGQCQEEKQVCWLILLCSVGENRFFLLFFLNRCLQTQLGSAKAGAEQFHQLYQTLHENLAICRSKGENVPDKQLEECKVTLSHEQSKCGMY